MKNLIITKNEVNWIECDNSEYGKYRKSIGKNTMLDLKHLVSLAKEKGFELTEEAFKHNYEAWRSDYKSNYNHNGICVFTPCGCNELSFMISKGSQETYFC